MSVDRRVNLARPAAEIATYRSWQSSVGQDTQTFAKFTPLYGLSQLVHYPLAGGTLQWGWILNLALWLAIFVAGAVWSLRRDTARV